MRSLAIVVSAVAVIAPSAGIIAQGEAAQPVMDVVLVTAQKRSAAEDAQSVPVALTVLGGAALETLHATSMEHLVSIAPNVAFEDAGTIPGFANFTIRGLGINSTVPSVEPTVGVFVDGIYLGMSTGAVLDLFDVSDVEILRGPQATLFGRNTTGGAVLVSTRRPGPELAARGRLSVESGTETKLGASVEGPLAATLDAKVAVFLDRDEGWFTNRFDGRSYGANRGGFVRPMLVWTPSDGFDTTLIYERGWSRGDGAPVQNRVAADGFGINVDYRGYHDLDQTAATLVSNVDLGAGVLTNLLGYRTLHQAAADDIDGQPLSRFNAFSLLRQHQISDELRYAVELGQRVDLTAGLYYFDQEFRYFERRVLNNGAIDSSLGAVIADTNYALFAEASIALASRTTVIAGGRLTSEQKSARTATFLPSTAASLCDFARETCAFNFPGAAFPRAPGSKTWDHFTPKLGVTFRPDGGGLVYGTWTRGLRSGGYNARNASVIIPPGPYDSEIQRSLEAGVKRDWAEGRVRLNAAIFGNRMKHMQRDVTETDPVVGIVQVTRNTADAHITGFETEVAARVGANVTLTANVGHLHGAYDEIFYDLDGGGIGASDLALELPRLAKWTYDLGWEYARELRAGRSLRVRADYGRRSRAALTDNNSSFLVPAKNLTASAALTLPGRWSVSIYGRNLLDTVSEGVISPLPPTLGGGTFRTLNEGRVVGAEVAFEY